MRKKSEKVKTRVFGPSIPWSLLFLAIIFGTIAVSVWALASGGMNLTGFFFFCTAAVVVAAVFAFFIARYYYITDRGITIKVLGAMRLGAWPWERLAGTRGRIMQGRHGPTNATARRCTVYMDNGRPAFTFSSFTADFGGLHNEIFHHIRVAKREMEEEED